VLIGHYVVLVFGVDRLKMRWYIDVFRRELRGSGIGEGLKKVGVV
jgi:hypothetical protein